MKNIPVLVILNSYSADMDRPIQLNIIIMCIWSIFLFSVARYKTIIFEEFPVTLKTNFICLSVNYQQVMIALQS